VTETRGGENKMKKIIVLTMMLVFLWTGASFAENWIIYYDGGSLQSYFDAGRVYKSGNGFDYWIRDTFTPEFLGNKYLVQHHQVELRNNQWWIRILETWYIDTQGKENDRSSQPLAWEPMKWADKPHGKALLDGLRKYGR
jgi:hypothetical protein